MSAGAAERPSGIRGFCCSNGLRYLPIHSLSSINLYQFPCNLSALESICLGNPSGPVAEAGREEEPDVALRARSSLGRGARPQFGT